MQDQSLSALGVAYGIQSLLLETADEKGAFLNVKDGGIWQILLIVYSRSYRVVDSII